MSAAMILAQNKLENASTITVTDTASGDFDKEYTTDRRTYTRWKSNGTGTKTIYFSFGSAQTFTAIGIAGHNLGTVGATVQFVKDAGIVNLGSSFDPSDDTPILKNFTSTSTQVIGIQFSGGSAAYEIGVIFAGSFLGFDRPPRAPYIPGQRSSTTERAINDYAHIMGVNGKAEIITANPTFDYVTNSKLAEIQGFWDGYAKDGQPFFFSWDNTNFPEDCIYGWWDGDFTYEKNLQAYAHNITIPIRGAL